MSADAEVWTRTEPPRPACDAANHRSRIAGEGTTRLVGALGAVLLLISPLLPYWTMRLAAPQYPRGLSLAIYPNRVAGDVAEIDGLNHYIGMRKIDDAATLERRLGLPAIAVMAIGLAVAAAWRSRWAVLLAVPVILFPQLFLADLTFWLRDSGLNLDPKAAFSSSIKPFVPRVLGAGKIAQFRTEAALGWGYYFCLASAAAGAWVGYRRWRTDASPRSKPAGEVGRRVGVGLGVLLGCVSSLDAETIRVEPGRSPSTIQEALEAASPGDEIRVLGGVHRGPIVVRKSIRLVGEDRPVLDGGGKGTVVRLEAPRCELRGFIIRSSGATLEREDMGVLAAAADITVADNDIEDVLFGISVKQAARCVVRGNRLRGKDLPIARRGDLIKLWYSEDVTIEDNTTRGGRDVVLWYSRNLTIRGNRVRDGRYGLHFMYCNDAVVAGNDLRDNSVGAFLMYSRRLRLERNWISSNCGPSGYGIGLKDMDDAVITHNVLVGNKVGAFLEHAHGRVEHNYVGDNDRGLVLFPTATGNRFAGNSLVENGEQVVVEGMAGNLAGNVWIGNYWSDYRGFDRNGDGFGELPHQPAQLFERLADRQPALRLFATSPSTRAIDFASRVFPVFEPKPKLVDPSPAMRPYAPPLVEAGAGSGWDAILLGAALLAGPAGLALVRSAREAAGGRAARRATVRAASGRPAPLEGTSVKAVDLGAPKEPAISVRAVTKRYGRAAAVEDLSFEVRPGETVALWGPNGAGKTTIVRCILGLLPFEGEIHLLGKPCGPRGRESRGQIGYVPQEVKLHADRSIRETVSFFARLRRVGLDRADALIAEWGLKDVERRAVRQLSGGMKQKLALVVALLSDPSVLLLDEPTSNLDARTRREFGELLERLKAAGKTLLFCTHRHSEVWRLADRVVVLQKGRKIAEGLPEQVREHLQEPAHLCLAIDPAHADLAAHVLREAGFDARQTGPRLLVDAPAGRRMEVLELLARRGATVLDFDLETDRGGSSGPADREGGNHNG
ncbi:MAG: nitrous oxide reductase family maturation protein NosD [Isosphaeraceae bacterium]